MLLMVNRIENRNTDKDHVLVMYISRGTIGEEAQSLHCEAHWSHGRVVHRLPSV